MEELKNYIENCRKKGETDLQIKEKLIKNGWTEERLNVFFEEVIPKPSEDVMPMPVPEEEEISSFKSAKFKMLDPKVQIPFAFRGIWFFFAIWIFIGGPILASTEETGVSVEPALKFLILIFSIAAPIIYGMLQYKFYKYAVSSEGFKKELGIISKKFTTIPYSKIQNIDIKQSVLDRILGIYSINIQTAGTSGKLGAEGILPGLNYNDANNLRTELLKRAKIN